MADRKKFVLHYGGKDFDIPETQHDVLNGLGDGTGVVKIKVGEGKWLSFVYGPGIPISLEERVVTPARSFS